ncbi:hypothetical protein [Mesorhizobium sp.]|uniref:hypothetical protein n=1 Tax=Mesorhizobium sp. TaxID=1871066 RepID=UPI000FE5D136|nr:hypothetical protein [Mesorhizobium sp.]RWP05104.1 MAG: hypothetical protein EOQ99_16675 [Mesorhizobium sp.]
MPRIASTTSSGVQLPGGGATLDALMRRQRELAERQAQLSGPSQGSSTIAGGLGQMANAMFTGLAQHKAEQQEAEGRQALTQILSGINPETGATSEQWGQAYQLDPDLGAKLLEGATQARVAARQREQQLADIASQRAYQEGQTASQRTYEEGRSAVKTVTGEEAKARGLDPTRTWQVGATGEAKDITPDIAESYRPPTQAEIEAYGLKPDTPVRINTKTGKPEAIGGGPALQLVPSETGARLGLADEFLRNFETVRDSAAAGEMTGAMDQPKSTILGWGPGGESYRQLKQGTEGLVRLMTGAGMSQGEAVERARQYEPAITDDADTLVSKVEGLRAAIVAVRSGATFGRQSPEEPIAKPLDLPEGVSEEDIQTTMAKRGMTREQVLQAIAAKRGGQ